MKKGTLAMLLVILVMVGVMMATASNPDKRAYIGWTVGRMTAVADPGMVKSVIVAALEPVVDSSTTKTNYMVCSVYDLNLPGYKSRTLGLFGNFTVIREENSFKKAFETIMQSSTTNASPVLGAVKEVANAAKDMVTQTLPQEPSDIVNGYSVDDLRKRLILYGYSESIDEAFWVMDQGDAILPAINQLMYAPVPADATGAFPYNVFFALSKYKGEAVKEILIHHSQYPEALLALDAIEAREKNAENRVIINDVNLYDIGDYRSAVLSILKPGCVVLVLEERIENPNAEGPMGGPSVYDHIQVVGTGEIGYVDRVGGGLPSFW